MPHCNYLLSSFSLLLEYMLKFEKDFDMDFDIDLKNSLRLERYYTNRFDQLVEAGALPDHSAYDRIRPDLETLFSNHLFVLTTSISLHFEMVVARMTRNRRLRCCKANHQLRRSRIQRIKGRLIQLYQKLLIKIARRGVADFDRQMLDGYTYILEDTELRGPDGVLRNVRDKDHGLS